MRFATHLGIQHNGAPKPNTTNAEGHAAFREDLKQSIARIAFTGVLSDSFYGKENQQAGEFIPLCLDAANKEPGYLLNAALVSRKANFKLFPKIAVGALISSCDTKAWAKVEAHVIPLLSTYSAGQLLELALVFKAKELGKGLGSRAQRILGLALASKNQKQLEDMTLSDRSDLQRLLRLLHPKLSPDQAALLPYVLGDVHRATTPRQEAMDALGGSAAQADLIRAHKLPFNATKGSANKNKDTWEAIRDNMSPLQVLLNLKALDERNAMTPQFLQEFVAGVDVSKTRLVPHDVLRPLGMAGEMPNGSHYREPLTNLLAKLASVPIPGLGDKRVGILLDFSGSMAPGYGQSSLGNWVLAVTLASPIMAACPNRHLAFFGGQACFEGQSFGMNHYGQRHECDFPYLKGCPPEAVFHNLLGLAPNSSTDIAAGINLFTANGVDLDVLFLFTDEQQNGQTPGHQAWNQYRGKNPKAKLVVVNVSNTKWHIANESDPSITIIQSITPLIFQQFARFDESGVEFIEKFSSK